MNKDKEIKESLEKEYQLIPMSEITDEARIIAVAWMECGDRDWIGQKHKLASDIMNYARRQNEALEQTIVDQDKQIVEQKQKIERLKEWVQLQLKTCVMQEQLHGKKERIRSRKAAYKEMLDQLKNINS